MVDPAGDDVIVYVVYCCYQGESGVTSFQSIEPCRARPRVAPSSDCCGDINCTYRQKRAVPFVFFSIKQTQKKKGKKKSRAIRLENEGWRECCYRMCRPAQSSRNLSRKEWFGWSFERKESHPFIHFFLLHHDPI